MTRRTEMIIDFALCCFPAWTLIYLFDGWQGMIYLLGFCVASLWQLYRCFKFTRECTDDIFKAWRESNDYLLERVYGVKRKADLHILK